MSEPSAAAYKPPDRAAQWARWSARWSRVAPVVEAASWYPALDAHTKAYIREAVTKHTLAETDLERDAAIKQFLRWGRNISGQDALWRERIETLAAQAMRSDDA